MPQLTKYKVQYGSNDPIPDEKLRLNTNYAFIFVYSTVQIANVHGRAPRNVDM